MPALFLYLLEVNFALVLSYLAYQFLLHPLTFYSLNRIFLNFGIVFSLVYPFMNVSVVLGQHQEFNDQFAAIASDWEALVLIPAQGQLSSFWQVLNLLYWGGVGLMTMRLFGQLLSLYRIHQRSISSYHGGLHYRQVEGEVNPFSFWQTAYLNPSQHPQEELSSILRHEHIHVRHWHTLDVLLGEVNMVLCWFNPVAWLLKQGIKENLEFFTDREMLQSGINSQAYQFSLVRISSLRQGIVLVNNFNFLTIKKRITMMNKKQSPIRQVARYVVLIPLVAAPMLVFTACSEDPVATSPITIQKQASEQAKSLAATVYYLDGKEVTNDIIKKLDSKEIRSINVYKGESAIKAFGDKGGNGVVEITTKKNQDSPQVN